MAKHSGVLMTIVFSLFTLASVVSWLRADASLLPVLTSLGTAVYALGIWGSPHHRCHAACHPPTEPQA
ncbi:MAG: hypothetical protein GC161_06055 [Planctomycetaceae bacterium]|nr:hypothetical protein [Planctomycetaceae bacterium]